MKLKKVLSMALAGVLALSMLTACNSSTGTTSSVVEAATTSSAKTSVTALVQAGMKADKVGAQQAALTLSGNEDADLVQIKNMIAGIGNSLNVFTTKKGSNDLIDLSNLVDYDSSTKDLKWYVDFKGDKGNKNLYIAPVGGLTDQDVANGILELMEGRWSDDTADANASAKDHWAIGSISAFKFADTADALSAHDMYITIDGEVYNLSETYFVVITMSSSTTLA